MEKGRFGEMLDSLAQVEARRRRASSVDSPDYEKAWEHLVTSTKAHRARSILLDCMGLIGGSLIAYAINVMTGSGDAAQVWLSMAGGVPLVLSSFYVRYIRD